MPKSEIGRLVDPMVIQKGLFCSISGQRFLNTKLIIECIYCRASNAPRRSPPDIPKSDPNELVTGSDLCAMEGDKAKDKPNGRGRKRKVCPPEQPVQLNMVGLTSLSGKLRNASANPDNNTNSSLIEEDPLSRRGSHQSLPDAVNGYKPQVIY